MREPNSFDRDPRHEDSTGDSPPGAIRAGGVHPFSRRDLLRTGAAGLVGLGLPIAASQRARADFTLDCFPYGRDNPIKTVWGTPPGPHTEFNILVNTPTLNNGQLCVDGRNNSGSNVVLVWDIFNAPNANAYDCNVTRAFLDNQTWMAIYPFLVPPGYFNFCVPVPNTCFQGDLGGDPVNYQCDLGVFPWDAVQNNPGLIGIPTLVQSSTNILAAILVGSKDKCPAPPCIRMTGGGGTVLTLGGITLETKQGFQLRTGDKSNLELHFTSPDGSSHTFKVGPKDTNNFMGAFTPCPGGGGGQPLNNPNTIFGTSTGTLDGQPGSVFLNFVDCGEPGTDDTRQIAIYDSSGVPQVVASGVIQNGNNQAHKC